MSEKNRIFFTGNIKKYDDYLTRYLRKSILKIGKEDSKKLQKSILSTLLGDEPPRGQTNVKHNKNDYFMANVLFRPFLEINKSYQSMQNILVYISTHPYQKKKISIIDYFQYNIENYIQEIYIMKERLISYLRKLKHAYSKSKLFNEVKIGTNKLEAIIERSFEGAIKRRTYHVHEIRYSDRDIDRLSLFDTLSSSEDKKLARFMNIGYTVAFKEIRSKWQKTIKNNSKEILHMIDLMFKKILEMIYKKGEIIYPWSK